MAISLNNLRPAEGATHSEKRIGRGTGSGRGGTSTRGHKGAQSRSGYSRKIGFEGGQMPMKRRLPKFGFKNPFRVEYQAFSLDDLTKAAKLLGSEVTVEALREIGMVKGRDARVKLLNAGTLEGPVTITVHAASKSAIAAVEAVGGTINLIPKPQARNTDPDVRRKEMREERAQARALEAANAAANPEAAQANEEPQAPTAQADDTTSDENNNA